MIRPCQNDSLFFEMARQESTWHFIRKYLEKLTPKILQIFWVIAMQFIVSPYKKRSLESHFALSINSKQHVQKELFRQKRK